MEKDHPEVKFGKTGILLINLGTPDSTSWWDIRKYLQEFLSDKRVIELNPLIWKVILNLFILTFRPSKTAHAYKKIWINKTNESPLLYFTRNQSLKLSKKIGNNKVLVDFAMRYGNPSIKKKINYFKNSIVKKINEINWKPDLIVASYHGIPKKYFEKGDPYHCYCHKTTRLISEKYSDVKIMTTFQSRFGPQEWLQPYTDKTFEALPNEGKKNILVICPGFSSDCVETLEEISIQGKESFIKSGGENFEMIPCLNDNEDHISLLKHLVSKNL